MKNSKLFYGALAALTAAIVALDQWTKWLTVQFLPIGTDKPSILGIFHITHVENDGAAWGLFGGKTVLFVSVLLLFVVIIFFLIYKKWIRKKFEFLCLAAILGGGIGNLIDRIAYGKVTDMICFDFIEFPVFNIADCFITVGCFALLIYVIFFDREKHPDKKEKIEQSEQPEQTEQSEQPE